MPITKNLHRCDVSRGAAVMSAVALLLALASIVSVYTARVRSFEQKIHRNSINYHHAHDAAQAGLENVVSQLAIAPLWQGESMTGEVADTGNYRVNLSRTPLTKGAVPAVLTTLEAQGRSADGLASVTMREDVVVAPLLRHIPPASVMVSDAVSANLQFTLVANPNGAGQGVPLSMWAKKALPGASLNGVSCALHEYQSNACASGSYSNAAAKGIDIIEQSSQFPADLNGWLFGSATSDWQLLMAQSNHYATNCADLHKSSGGLMWITGDCTIAESTFIGDSQVPVVLVIHNGALTMAQGSQIAGVVYVFRDPYMHAQFAIDMHSGATIRGALVANQPLGKSTSSVTVIYDAAVMSGLLEHELLLRVSRVPGSWRDF